MFNFLNEFTEQIGSTPMGAVTTYKYVNLGGNLIYVQGYRDILAFSDVEIVLKLKNGELKIFGSELNIKDLNINSVTISGKISGVEKVGEDD
jgi:sporulation protein YqfC